jgi:hypothetical protein
MLIWILIAVAAIVVVFLVVVALQPADFRIQRTALIAAPAQAVFAQVNDFRNWLAWSPWEKLDPQLKETTKARRQEPGRNTPGWATRTWAKAA